MGGHRTRKVRTLAPGPEGTEKTQDDEEKRDRKIRRMRFRTSWGRIQKKICGELQNKGL